MSYRDGHPSSTLVLTHFRFSVNICVVRIERESLAIQIPIRARKMVGGRVKGGRMNERINTLFRVALLSGVSILVLAAMPVAAAETADAEAQPEALGEITVTAQRREEKLSKVIDGV